VPEKLKRAALRLYPAISRGAFGRLYTVRTHLNATAVACRIPAINSVHAVVTSFPLVLAKTPFLGSSIFFSYFYFMCPSLTTKLLERFILYHQCCTRLGTGRGARERREIENNKPPALNAKTEFGIEKGSRCVYMRRVYRAIRRRPAAVLCSIG